MRSNLETFLLALVQADVHTPYEMMSKADISLGSSLPALARLEKAGLVQVTPGPSRKSKVFRTTGKGSALLSREWRRVVDTSGDDLDSILRGASLLWARNGSDRGKSASKFLKQRAATLKKKLKKSSSEPEITAGEITARGGLKERYRWLRRSLETARRDAEIAAIFNLARRISPNNGKKNSA